MIEQSILLGLHTALQANVEAASNPAGCIDDEVDSAHNTACLIGLSQSVVTALFVIAMQAIIEAANNPTTLEGDTVLRERDIPVCPDIYANGGGEPESMMLLDQPSCIPPTHPPVCPGGCR